MLTKVVWSQGVVCAASRHPSWTSTTGWPCCRTVSAEPPRGSAANASATASKAGSNEPSMWRTVVAGRPVPGFPALTCGDAGHWYPIWRPENDAVMFCELAGMRTTKRSDPVAVLPNPSYYGTQPRCAPGAGELLGQMGWNREKPVDDPRKTW